jgi:hypothetical protein
MTDVKGQQQHAETNQQRRPQHQLSMEQGPERSILVLLLVSIPNQPQLHAPSTGTSCSQATNKCKQNPARFSAASTGNARFAHKYSKDTVEYADETRFKKRCRTAAGSKEREIQNLRIPFARKATVFEPAVYDTKLSME